MINLTIDGISEQINTENFRTFRNLFDILTGEMSNEGRAVTEVTINGTTLLNNDLYEQLDKPITFVHTLSIKSVTKTQLIEEQLGGLSDHIATMIVNIGKAADSFRVGDDIESQKYFAAVLEGLRWFNYSIDLILAFLKIDSHKEKIGNELISQRIAEVSEIVSSLADSQDNGDWIMLADQLEYELVPSLQKWLKTIPLLKQFV